MKTPRFEFSKMKLKENVDAFKLSITEAEIFYSVKCNASALVLRELAGLGVGFEISSKLEYERLRGLGVPCTKMIFGLPVKPLELTEYLAAQGVDYFVFDDMSEYHKLHEALPNPQKILRIYIKDIAPHCIEYGMQMDRVLQNLAKMQDIDGVSFHISENTNIDILLTALDRAEEVLQRLPPRIHILNIGGSYEVRSDLKPFYEKLNERLKRLKNQYQLKVYAEPGSALVNTAGRVICKVIMAKDRDGFTDVYIDAGIPVGVMRLPGYINVVDHDICLKKRRYYRFFDITSLHRLLFQSKLPYMIKEGNLLELGEYGAYSLCYRNDFHCWETPEEVLY